MRITSELYEQILADPEHVKEWRATIGSDVYDKRDIVSIRRSSALYGKQLIGGACSGSLELVLHTTKKLYIWTCYYVYDLGFIANFSGTWDEFYNKYHSGIGNVEIGTKLNGEYGAPIVEDYSLVTTAEEAKAAMLEGKTFVAGWEDIDGFEERWIILQSLELVDGEWRVSAKAYGYDYEATDRIYFRGVTEGDEVSSQDRSAYPDDGYTVERPEPFSDYWYVYDRAEEIKASVPEMARIELSVRLVSDLGTSEWLLMGTYWVNRRKDNQEDDTLTLQCVDGMMFAEQDFYPVGSEITDWDQVKMSEVAQMCADKMGLTLEDSTQFHHYWPYIVYAPPIGYSVRQVLQGLAAAHGGNIVVTADNKLRLVRFVPGGASVNIGKNAASMETGKQYEAFGNIIFNFESADGGKLSVRYPEVEASGATMEAPLLTVTDAGLASLIAQDVLRALGSYRYTPYNATDALIDPAMELGDKITVDGVSSVIAEADDICDELYSASIGAESYEETRDEFLYKPSAERMVERKMAQTRASLSIKIDGVITRVQSAEGNISSLGIEVGQIDARVESAEGNISNLSLAVGQISSEVSGKITTYRQVTTPVTSTIGDLWYCTMPNYPYEQDTWYRWNGSEWEKSSEVVDIPVAPEWELGLNYYKGNVVDIDGRWYIAKSDHTATSANKPPNSTYWDYQPSISSISRSQINQTMSEIELSVNESSLRLWGGGLDIVAPTANLKVNAANITGTLTVGWSNVSDKPTFSNVATSGSYNDLSNKPNIPSEHDITTIVGNTVTTGYVNALGITAEYLSANAVIADGIQLSGLLDVRSGRKHYGYLGGSDNFDSAGVVLTSPNANNFCVATNDACKISYGNVHNIFTYSTGCYSSSQMQIGSDRRLKDNIEYDVDRFDGVFDALKPCSFVYKNDADRTHFGLIAQEVTQSIDASELPWDNLALIGHLSLDDTYSVAYGELIAVCIAQIQKLKERVTSLEATS